MYVFNSLASFNKLESCSKDLNKLKQNIVNFDKFAEDTLSSVHQCVKEKIQGQLSKAVERLKSQLQKQQNSNADSESRKKVRILIIILYLFHSLYRRF